jgi:hypothetical protein
MIWPCANLDLMIRGGKINQPKKKGKREGFGFLGPVLDSVSQEAWNRQQLAKMVKLGGAFVSEN